MMIDAIATRRIRLNGVEYAKGDKVTMPLQQFQDFKPTGRFTRAPAEKPAPKAKAAETKSSNAAD